ncbi:Biotin synthase [Carex littledalei]|uniref:Biotin synthase n=1 Tax=Carex littledalei TaxID=544730 RepID=A0A833R0T6_9POAL|nr:Biotin synthase [Carex littledalei]
MLLVRSLRSRLRPPTSGAGAAVSAFSTSAAAMEAERTINKGLRNYWSKDEIKAVYDSPVLDLLFHGVYLPPINLHFSDQSLLLLSSVMIH